MHAAEIAGHRRAKLLPVEAAVGRAQQCPGGAGYPADLVRRSLAADEIGDHAADLREPGFAAIDGMGDLPTRADVPYLFPAGRSDANVQSDVDGGVEGGKPVCSGTGDLGGFST